MFLENWVIYYTHEPSFPVSFSVSEIKHTDTVYYKTWYVIFSLMLVLYEVKYIVSYFFINE